VAHQRVDELVEEAQAERRPPVGGDDLLEHGCAQGARLDALHVRRVAAQRRGDGRGQVACKQSRARVIRDGVAAGRRAAERQSAMAAAATPAR